MVLRLDDLIFELDLRHLALTGAEASGSVWFLVKAI